MVPKLLPLNWRDNNMGEVPEGRDKMSYEATTVTVFGQYRITYWNTWKLRFNGGLIETCESLTEAKEKAFLDHATKVGELYGETDDSKWKVPVKGLEWQKRDVWWARCDITNRDYAIFEEEGRAWAHVGGVMSDYDSVEIAKQQVDAWRADLIRSALED